MQTATKQPKSNANFSYSERLTTTPNEIFNALEIGENAPLLKDSFITDIMQLQAIALSLSGLPAKMLVRIYLVGKTIEIWTCAGKIKTINI